MGLRSVGNRLLAIGGRLVNACCCRVLRYACVTTGVDSCGNTLVECQRVDSGGQYETADCDGQCPEPPPCECDPPCSGCEECIDGECVPSYGPCEQCEDGSVVPLCGECETCVDGICYPCPEGYECVDGICVDLPPPDEYYCCYVEAGSDGTRGTACTAGPCGNVVGGVFIPVPGLIAAGPFASAIECAKHCQRHTCRSTTCGNRKCEPSYVGEYDTLDACRPPCEDSPDPPVVCSIDPASPATFSGGGAGTFNYLFSIAAVEDCPVCVSYVSTNCRPIRVQIYAPLFSPDGCTQIGDRDLKRDSQWRGIEGFGCERTSFVGPPKGFVRWSPKQKNVTSFEVQVITDCADNEWQIVVTTGDCAEVPDMDCPCDCGTVRPNEGCVSWPFGIEGNVAAAILTIEWCGLTWNGDPLDGVSVFAPPIAKSIERSRFPAESLLYCQQDENGDWHLRGIFVTSYSDNIATLEECTNSTWWLLDYKIDLDNDRGGLADVSVFRSILTGPQPCGCEEVPVVTITLP
jgi:hypothetical protein